MRLTSEQIARIIIETANQPNPPADVIIEWTSSVKDCKRIVELVKTLDYLHSILDNEFYNLCKNILELYSVNEEIKTEDVAELITQLNNKILFSR